MDINPQFVDDLLLGTLLTTVVENLHAVSHLKHETFTVLTYAQDFGTVCKESLKCTTRWAEKYYTHDKSYYPVPQSAMPLSAIATMTPLPSVDITPGMEGQIKEWLESYRPVYQRTVRSETTKDKAGALPPAVYAVRRTDNESEERLRYPEENNVSSANVQRVVSIQFVDEGDVIEAFEDHREVQIDEYETDSDDEESELVNRACVKRSGRAVKPVKPREPLNNKCNKFLWTSWKKDFRSLLNYVSQGLEWAFHSFSNLQLLIYFDAP